MVTMADLQTPKQNTWCPGCGNFGILMAFKRAIIELGLERNQVLLVSGIGCHGKMVDYVNINGFHGIHGRVIPIATGIKLVNPDLKVVGFSGDADCYDEGFEHFTHAIRRNVDMTLIVHDNMVLGLTTGQATATSMKGFKTKSTPFGATSVPLNPIAHALVSNGTFVARGFAGDMVHLQKLMVEAMKHRGFAYIDVFQPCVTFNYLNTYDWYKQRVYKLEEAGHDTSDRQKALERAFEWGDRIPIGIFYKEERPTFLDEMPHIKANPILKQKIEDTDIITTMKTILG
jgi:2-oxoglutarate ferredoxin oxidoreductase subunit beta